MIATSVGYDVIFIIHIAAAVATIAVFVTMRYAAVSVARGADATTQASRFPQKPDWAARFLHVLPVTGLVMSLSGGSDVSLARPWVGVGLFCYLAAAGHLEARTLPQERVIAETVAHQGVAPPEAGRQFVRSVDTLLALVAVALVAMLVQF
ncbi:MAG TPA: hypothetical protein VGZ04_04685 [Acidimicrobiales bacterium]|jgi:hypothetical protein|nr:hypothetical protein [Acidimicrobiales bacterium]